MGSPALPRLLRWEPELARPGQTYECLSGLAFADFGARASLRITVRRGAGETIKYGHLWPMVQLADLTDYSRVRHHGIIGRAPAAHRR